MYAVLWIVESLTAKWISSANASDCLIVSGLQSGLAYILFVSLEVYWFSDVSLELA